MKGLVVKLFLLAATFAFFLIVISAAMPNLPAAGGRIASGLALVASWMVASFIMKKIQIQHAN